MIVRREDPRDRDAIAEVHALAFGQGQGTSAEERLVAELRADDAVIPALSLVAVVDGRVVGHVMCSSGRVGHRPLPGLGPLGVLPALQRRGVGSALLHAVLGAADALDLPGVVLLGSPAYYGRFGFVPATSLGVQPPDPGWGDHFQLRRLTAWDATLSGTFEYAAAFARL